MPGPELPKEQDRRGDGQRPRQTHPLLGRPVRVLVWLAEAFDTPLTSINASMGRPSLPRPPTMIRPFAGRQTSLRHLTLRQVVSVTLFTVVMSGTASQPMTKGASLTV